MPSNHLRQSFLIDSFISVVRLRISTLLKHMPCLLLACSMIARSLADRAQAITILLGSLLLPQTELRVVSERAWRRIEYLAL